MLVCCCRRHAAIVVVVVGMAEQVTMSTSKVQSLSCPAPLNADEAPWRGGPVRSRRRLGECKKPRGHVCALGNHGI
jgi:hypothetical protein